MTLESPPGPRAPLAVVLVTYESRRFLKELGYDYADETRNPAYRLFLK